MQIGKTVKKIGTLLVGTALMGSAMLGAVSGTANLGNYPAPFATSDDFASTIVVGASAATADVVGAINIAASLAQTGAESQEISVSCDSGVTSVENGAKIETKTKKLRFSDASVYSSFADVKASLSSKDLDLLNKETVTYTDGTTTSYTQLLTLSTVAKVYFTEDDTAGDKVTTPRVVLQQPTTGALYEYKLIAASGLDTRDPDATSAGPGLSGEDMVIMGKTFTVGVQSDISHEVLVLYGGGEEKSLTAGGDAVTFTLDGEQHTIQMTSWTGTTGSNLKGVFVLDGVTHEKAENSAITVDPVTNSQITIKKVSETKMPSVSGGAATESATATIFIGSAKLTIDGNAGTIKEGDDTIDGAVPVFTNTTDDKITSLTITYTPDDRVVADVGEVIVDPVFGAFEYVFAGYSESDTASRDLVRVYKSSSTKMKLEYTNGDGDAYDMDLATLRAASSWVLGGSTDATATLHVTDNPTDIAKNDYFLLSDGENSYTMKYTAIDTTDNEITIRNTATAEEISIVYDGSGDGSFQVGAVTYVVDNVIEGVTKTFDITDADKGTTATGGSVVMYTTNGHKFTIAAGATVADTPEVTITEYDDQSDTDLGVVKVTATLTSTPTEIETIDMANSTGASNNGGLVSSTFVSVEDSKVNHGMTVYGSLVVDDTDADDIKMYLPDDQVTYDVYVMKAGVAAPTSTSTGTTTSATVSVSVPALSSSGVAVLDTEASSLKTSSNLILVGGPAVNTLVAELGTAGKVRTVDTWRTQTVPGVYDYQGEAVIEMVDDAFTAGKSVVVVAGFDAADTQAACNVLQNYANYATEFADKAKVKVVGTTVSEVVEAVVAEEDPVVEDETNE